MLNTSPDMTKLQAIVLAAGKGTRMKSPLPKVLHPLAGKPMLLHVLNNLSKAQIQKATVIIGYGKDEVRSTVGSYIQESRLASEISFAVQEEQKGTGHAVAVSEPYLSSSADFAIVLYGDVPLITPETMIKSYHLLLEENADGLVISMDLADPTGYGRIIRDNNNELLKIIEEKDASENEKTVREVNTGVFVFRLSVLRTQIHRIENNNAQGEFYLTDIVELMKNNGYKFIVFRSQNPDEFLGVNSPEQLAYLESRLAQGVF